jgi:acyl transferase domain-containing protein
MTTVDDTLRHALTTIRRLRQQNADLTAAADQLDQPIAIVGAGFRLPGGADNPDSLWQVLTADTDAVRPLPTDRWAHLDFSAFGPAAAGATGWAGVVDDVTGFDTDFFGISDREATLMDPQQRLALELTWEAIERSGWTLPDLQADVTGVILGVAHQDYLFTAMVAEPGIGTHLGAGNARSIIANRVSYLLGLTGPSLAVDTACSSSLMAIHLACQSLRTGEADRMFAGGVNLILSPLSTAVTGRALPLAPDGRCKALADGADGMVRAEGAGVVALRRLPDAVRDADPILGVILATGTNQDGRTNGLTAPNPVAQSRLLTTTLNRARLTPPDVTYVEMHGTGTPLGDPIEVEGIIGAYGAPAAPTCWLGSAKATFGHLESAAGVTSLIKVLEVLRRRQIPGQVNIERLNPEIRLDGTRFRVPSTVTDWSTAPGTTRAAGVSSFGFGGSNVHLIVQEPPAAPPHPVRDAVGRPVIIPVSTRGAGALLALGHRYADAVETIDDGAGLHRFAVAAARRRTHHPHHRAAVVCGPDPAAAAAALRELHPSACAPVDGVVLVYPGQTGQWAGMGAALAAADPVIRAELQAWDESAARHGFTDLVSSLFGPRSADHLADTRFAQLAIGALQAAITAKLRAVGVEPDAVIGHSVGEVSAAHAAGVLTRDDAVRVLLARGNALHTHATPGAMLAVAAGADEISVVLSATGLTRTGIAVRNGRRACVLAGPPAEIDAATDLLAHWRTTRLPTAYSFHAPFLRGAAADEVTAALSGLIPRPERCPLFSTVSGAAIPGTTMDAAHWARNVAEPVDFVDAVGAVAATGHWCYLEVGPGRTLLPHLTSEIGRTEAHPVTVTLLPPNTDEDRALHEGLARMWTSGVELNWSAVCPGPVAAVDLPGYPWQRRFLSVLADPGSADPPVAADAVTARPEPHVPHLGPDTVLDLLRGRIAQYMGLASGAAIDPDRPARDLDVDSMAFVELKNTVEDQLGVALPLTALLDGASLREIAATVAAGRSAAQPPAPTVPGHATAPHPSTDQAATLLTRLDEMTEAELDELLARLPGSDR